MRNLRNYRFAYALLCLCGKYKNISAKVPTRLNLQEDKFSFGAARVSNSAFAPKCQKPYLRTCAPKEDKDQSAHLRSLISLRCRMKKLCILG